MLDDQGIKAAFFIQAQVSCRMGNRKRIVKRLHDENHLIGIHTGSVDDHVLHPTRYRAPAEDVTGDGAPDGVSGLESDLIAAKTAITNATGSTPHYVRAVGGDVRLGTSDIEIFTLYRNLGLVHVCWNIDSLVLTEPSQLPITRQINF
ncbi:MAG: polysaccharide deacetylase family protein [Polyangiaceae bacterium]